MRLIGVDGCRAGWIVASSDVDLGHIEFEIIGTDEIGRLIERTVRDGDIAAIDIPIGLADAVPRACDVAARKYLKRPRASSVFPAPCRSALPASSYREACELNFQASGRKMSQQAFHILKKIRPVDAAMKPEHQERVRESHPEVVFARLLGEERGLTPRKQSAEGKTLRRRLLETRLSLFDLARIRRELGPSKLAVDDLLDALACLIAAQHIKTGQSLVLPCGEVECDRHGLRMEIVA